MAPTVLANSPMVWVGPRASDALGLVPQESLCAIVSCDYGQTGEYVRSLGVPLFSLEFVSGERACWSRGDFLSQAVVQAATQATFLDLLSPGPLILPYATKPTLESLAARFGARVLGPSSALRVRFDDKVEAARLFAALDLPTLPSITGPLQDLSFRVAADTLGTPFVVRSAFGSGGTATHVVRLPSEYQALCDDSGASDVALLQPYLPSYSINLNAVCSGESTYVAPASVQIVGVRECSTEPFAYCGNDFTAIASVPKAVRERAARATARIGDAMRTAGYRGVFGVDFIVADAEDVFPIEINARFQNSTVLLDRALAVQGAATLTELHLAAFGAAAPPKAAALMDPMAALPASQAILHSKVGSWAIAGGSLKEGIYECGSADESFRFTQAAHVIEHVGDNQFMLTCAVPQQDLCVAPNAPLLRLSRTGRLLDDDLVSLSHASATLVERVYTGVALQQTA